MKTFGGSGLSIELRFALIKSGSYDRGMELVAFALATLLLGALASAFGVDSRSEARKIAANLPDQPPAWPGKRT
jgi:hypothetical protein